MNIQLLLKLFKQVITVNHKDFMKFQYILIINQ